MLHLVRTAMQSGSFQKFFGVVESDETFVGGKRRATADRPREYGRGTSKAPVMVLVETDGRAVSHPIDRLRSDDLKAAMKEVIDPSAAIVTDELAAYPKAAADFAGGHYTVNHSRKNYVRTDGRHTNTAESFFALLKRGHYGTFHYISKKHLHRYCDEFAFRWNGRKLRDAERRTLAIGQVRGKRLMYKTPAGGLVS